MTEEQAQVEAEKLECREPCVAEQITATEHPHSPKFDDVFKAYDAWYYDKYRNHPERMSAESFYNFLEKHKIIKEAV